MRKTLTKIALVAFIAVLFPIMSCDDPYPSKLAKHWILEDGTSSMELFKDGTGIIGNKVKILWKVEDNHFLVTFVERPDTTRVIDYQLSGGKFSWNGLTFIEKAEYDAKSKKKETVASSEDNLETVQIGTQIWLKRNLNVVPSKGKSFCYANDPANCQKYGRLYNWATAMGLDSTCLENYCERRIETKHRGICPAGFHIPSMEEWQTLVDFAGGERAGRKLKAKSGWNDYDYLEEAPNGTDDFGFSALPGGYRTLDFGRADDFSGIGDDGTWWSRDQSNVKPNNVKYIFISNTGYVHSKTNINASKIELKSVRCIKD